MAYENVLSQLDSSISIDGAKAQYESSLSAKALPNPLLIDEETAYFKQTFSKLKFEYLEQETRDRFLRYILLKELYDVPAQDFEAISASNDTLKTSLKALKEDINSAVAVNEELLEEVLQLNAVHERKSTEVFGFIEEADQIGAQLESLINGSKDDQVLLNLQKAVRDSNVGDLDQFMKQSESVLEKEAANLMAISEEVASKEQEADLKKQRIERLEEQLAQLQQELTKSQNKNIEDDENRLLAQKLKDDYDLLARLSGLQIELLHQGQQYVLKTKGVVMLLDSDFHIVEVNGSRTNFRRWIGEVNGDDNKQARMQKLRPVLEKIQEELL